MDQSTPSFPEDQDYPHVPDDDDPPRKSTSSMTAPSSNSNTKSGASSDSKSGSSSSKDTYKDSSNKNGYTKEEADPWDKQFEGQSDPFSSFGPAGNFFEEYVTYSTVRYVLLTSSIDSDPPQPSLGAPAGSNTSSSQGAGQQQAEQPKANKEGKDNSASAPTAQDAGKNETPPPADGGKAGAPEAAAQSSDTAPPADAAPAPDAQTQSSSKEDGTATQDAGTQADQPPADPSAQPALEPASEPAPQPGPEPAPEASNPPPETASNAPPSGQDSAAPQDAASQPAEQPAPAQEPPPTQDSGPQPPPSAQDNAPPQGEAGQPAEAPAAASDNSAPQDASSQSAEAPASGPDGASQDPNGQPEGQSAGAEEAPQARRRAVNTLPRSIQQVKVRRSGERSRRASVQKRAGNTPVPAANDTPYFSPTPSFNSPVFASSPLSRAWKPSQASYSPSIYASPVSVYESPEIGPCGFNGQPCITTTPILSPPVAGFGANAMSSPVLESTPRINQSPIMSPLLSSSRRFASPSTSYNGATFNTQAQYGSANSQGAGTATPGSGFYNAVIATSIVGAAMCMGAFGILAWLLFRRRTPYHRPTISHPVLTYSSNDAYGNDDDEEKTGIPQSPHFQQVDPPSIPESVLPSNTWRPSMQYPVDGFGNSDQVMRETIHSMRSQQNYHQEPDMPMSPDPTRSMPGALAPAERGEYQQRQSDTSLQRKSSLSRHSSVPKPAPALMRSNSGREDRQRTRFADEVPHQSHPMPDHAYHHTASEGSQHSNYRQADAGDPSPPPMRARSSSKSSMSSQQASWELRKAAILASAQTSTPGMQHAPPSTNATPVNLSDTELKSSAESASPPSTTLSNSVSLVMLDKQVQVMKASTMKPRPVSQDGSAVRNKLKKGSPHNGKKVRPITIGAAPPSILVTSHPQALIPPPSPKPSQRVSVYSLTDTLPYLASASQSMASLGTAMAQDDISLIDPIYKRQSTMSYDNRSSLADGSVMSEEDANRCSLAESFRSEPAADPTSEEERAKRSQRRRTLLESVYKQEEQQIKSASSQPQQNRRSTDDPFTQETDYQTPGKHNARISNKSIPQPLPPLTPPYTPKVLPPIRPAEELTVETPTRRSRSVSAGAPGEGPSLDAALTRFSQIDLGSEFSLSKFGSVGAMKSAPKERSDNDGSNTRSNPDEVAVQQTRKSGGQNSKRMSMHGPSSAAAPSDSTAKPARRTRASTISCDQFKAGSAESMMTTAARVPLPNRSKATRVSFAPAMPSPPSTGTIRSIAQDLRASVNYPSGYDPSASRPTSYRTTMSSYRASSSDYDFDHVIDFAESARTSAFSSSSAGSQHKRKDAMSRISNGSLGVPDEDDDDGSVCKFARLLMNRNPH